MIKTFRNTETEAVYQGFQHPKFPAEIMRVAKRKLQMLDAACDLRDLKIPLSNSLEMLKRDRERGSGASESISNGASALSGQITTHTRLK